MLASDLQSTLPTPSFATLLISVRTKTALRQRAGPRRLDGQGARNHRGLGSSRHWKSSGKHPITRRSTGNSCGAIRNRSGLPRRPHCAARQPGAPFPPDLVQRQYHGIGRCILACRMPVSRRQKRRPLATKVHNKLRYVSLFPESVQDYSSGTTLTYPASSACPVRRKWSSRIARSSTTRTSLTPLRTRRS